MTSISAQSHRIAAQSHEHLGTISPQVLQSHRKSYNPTASLAQVFTAADSQVTQLNPSPVLILAASHRNDNRNVEGSRRRREVQNKCVVVPGVLKVCLYHFFLALTNFGCPKGMQYNSAR